ncbi:MAG TPA: sulfatase, partial [Planctomycetaceae bacterium]|nr:sulfatase [Planctomycetaceae bacterium]
MNINRDLQAARASYLRRRWFLHDCGLGLAGIAASALMKQDLSAEEPRGDQAAN